MSKVFSTGIGSYYGVTENVTAYRMAKNEDGEVTGGFGENLFQKMEEEAELQGFLPNTSGHVEQEKDYHLFLQKKINEIYVKLQNGDTENSYQIGAQSFTEEEWDSFLEKFDSIEEAIQELMKEEQSKKEETTVEELQKDSVDMLIAETTSCTYPTANPEDEEIRYITYYIEDGIHCRKAGETEDEWVIPFESEEQYEKVMNFIRQFPSDWNMRFAAHENFWRDFLQDEVDMEGFMNFMEGTNKGVPDYSITIGDSMYVDKEKMQWAEYLNPLGSRFYTAEEMQQRQMALMAANVANKTRVTNSVGDMVSGDAETDAFYSGLSSAVEKAKSRGNGEVLGLTTLPYNDSVSYGMTAFYSDKSTPTDPVIRVNCNYGGENRYFDVHVNEVNPSNASQLEMFALSCYTDDRGITDRGSFGSYSRMKTYAMNDSYLGRGLDLQNPENVGVKVNWVAILQRMAEEYRTNPQMYSQYQDCSKLVMDLEKWNESKEKNG